MSAPRPPEDRFFEGEGRDAPALPAPPRRRESPLLARSVGFAVPALVVSLWLLWGLLPDVAWFFAPLAPIDLGGPGAHRLEAARENRLVQIRGELRETVPVTVDGAPRTVGRLEGTNLLVDRPGRGGPPVFEGRLLPARHRGAYAEVAGVLRARGAPLDTFLVLRDGERPRQAWPPLLGAALCVAVAALNLRALAKKLLPRPERPPA